MHYSVVSIELIKNNLAWMELAISSVALSDQLIVTALERRMTNFLPDKISSLPLVTRRPFITLIGHEYMLIYNIDRLCCHYYTKLRNTIYEQILMPIFHLGLLELKSHI